MTLFATLTSAIEDMAVIVISYDGSKREVEPHLLGRNKKGNICLSAFQTSGGSGCSFRGYLLDKIESVELTGEHFSAARDGYNPNDQNMVEIFARL